MSKGDASGPGLAVLRDRSRIRVSAFGAIPIAGGDVSNSAFAARLHKKGRISAGLALTFTNELHGHG